MLIHIIVIIVFVVYLFLRWTDSGEWNFMFIINFLWFFPLSFAPFLPRTTLVLRSPVEQTTRTTSSQCPISLSGRTICFRNNRVKILDRLYIIMGKVSWWLSSRANPNVRNKFEDLNCVFDNRVAIGSGWQITLPTSTHLRSDQATSPCRPFCSTLFIFKTSFYRHNLYFKFPTVDNPPNSPLYFCFGP